MYSKSNQVSGNIAAHRSIPAVLAYIRVCVLFSPKVSYFPTFLKILSILLIIITLARRTLLV